MSSDIKKYKKILKILEDKYTDIEHRHWDVNDKMASDGIKYDFSERYNELLKETKDVCEEIRNVNFELKKIKPIIFKDLDDIGHHMTFEEFKNCCESGGFIDYDGSGYYSTIDKQSNKSISPSDFKKNRILHNDTFTHIRWYNR